MKSQLGGKGHSQPATSFQPLAAEEMLLVEGGLSWSGIWDAVKDAACWVKDHVFVDIGNQLFGYKGIF